MSAAAPRLDKATPGWPFSLALNHLLEAEPWARARLARFAGATVELRSPPLPPVRLTVLSSGTVRPAGAEPPEPALVVTLRPDALIGLARGPEHFLRSIDVAGDPALAGAVMALARHLRWDVEEDLARLFGDAAAHRLAGAGRALVAWQVDAARRFTEALGDYVIDESRMLTPRQALEDFGARVARLRDAVERLEKRVERLA